MAGYETKEKNNIGGVNKGDADAVNNTLQAYVSWLYILLKHILFASWMYTKRICVAGWNYFKVPKENANKHVEWDNKVKVEGEINKRTLGRFMIKECGHEGAENTEAQQYLRKLVQGCIDDLQKYPDINWADASLEISGFDGKQYLIESGKGKQRIYAMLDYQDKVIIIKKYSIFETFLKGFYP